MTRDREQVVAWARGQANRRTTGWAGMCLKFARMAAGASGGVKNARMAWGRARYTHTSWPPPRGTFVFWRGGKHGHVSVSSGDGDHYTTDLPVRGQVRWGQIRDVADHWGYEYLGWSEDINGVTPLHPSRVER
jgi:hypothetical protein